jgi:hypothetical protein
MVTDKTYVLYLRQEWGKGILLGAGKNPSTLYQNALNPQTAEKNNKSLILKWLTLVETNLDDVEKKDLHYAFMCNPQTKFSYPIKDLTLCIKLIKEY